MLSLPTILILAMTCTLSVASPEADPGDEFLRSEIESAARESRALADDLAAMLARLEAEENREDAVEAAVIGDNEKVKEALTEMVDKIEDLAKASEDSNLSKIAGSVENTRIKEDELKDTLEELEIVAIQIEAAASSADSSNDIDAIEEAAILLQTVSDKVEEKTNNIDKGNGKSTNRTNKEIETTALELNGIDEMIASLEKVTHDLRELNVQGVDEVKLEQKENKAIEKERNEKTVDERTPQNTTAETDGKVSAPEAESKITQIRQPKQLDSEDEISAPEAESKITQIRQPKQLDSEDEISAPEAESKITQIRQPKQLDLEDSFNTDDDERKQESKSDSKNKEGNVKDAKKLEEGEECTVNDATNRVRVCVPKVTSVDSTIHLYSGLVKEERHCYDVTKTICQESSQIVSKEVCVYDYKQKTVVAPAQMTEVTWEKREEKLAVSKCKKEIIKEGYKEKAVEICKQEYVQAPFTLPSIAENINEFIDMSIPEPDERCQTYRYEIPEVICKDVTTRECSDLAHVEPVAVTEYLDTVQMDYKGKCAQRALKQQQQICIKEEKVKQPRQSYRG